VLRKPTDKPHTINKPELKHSVDGAGCQLNNIPTKRVFTEMVSKAVYSQTYHHPGLLKCCWQFHSTSNHIQREKIQVRICSQCPKRFVTVNGSGWINEDTFRTCQAHGDACPCLLLSDDNISHTNLQVSRTALGPTQPPIKWVPGALSLGVKRLGREVDHSPISSAEVKE
jgi:hypothetical protein